ncbi:hypothetical protein [Caballeronia sp. Sq4a]|uniref:hypothetical protein n=1 Tax=Caballeronia sp. Sq4a TaxID=2878152 RepID=UPI0020C09818|nr:hypothetical protein [Caballeronia sp. Sq4a]
MKSIEVQISTECGTLGLPPKLLGQAGRKLNWDANESNAFGLVAMVTAPPTYVGFSLADTWAHQRYFAAVDPLKAHLSLRHEWIDLDPHQKTILADDWGMGFPLLYLMEVLDMVHFAPTDYWVKSIELATGTKLVLKKGKQGPPKLPDFIGMDTAGRYHAIECKGTQKSRSALSSAIKRGVPQVENLRALGALPAAMHACFDSWLVAGLYVPTGNKKTRPLLKIADPDFSSLSDLIDRAGGIQAVTKAIFLTALCQQLASVGLRRLASILFSGKAQPSEIELVRTQAGISEEARRAGFVTNGNFLVADRKTQIFDPQRQNVGARIREVKSSYSAPAKLVESLALTVQDNGNVNRQQLDLVLSNLVSALPGNEPRSTPLPRDEGRERTPWISREVNGRSQLRSQFGIQIDTALDSE